MNASDILTNEFAVRYDESESALLIYTIHSGTRAPPIRVKLETLRDMGSAASAKWVGETLLLLIPKLRTELYNLPNT